MDYHTRTCEYCKKIFSNKHSVKNHTKFFTRFVYMIKYFWWKQLRHQIYWYLCRFSIFSNKLSLRNHHKWFHHSILLENIFKQTLKKWFHLICKHELFYQCWIYHILWMWLLQWNMTIQKKIMKTMNMLILLQTLLCFILLLLKLINWKLIHKFFLFNNWLEIILKICLFNNWLKIISQ